MIITGRAKPRGAYPHYRRAGDFIFVIVYKPIPSS